MRRLSDQTDGGATGSNEPFHIRLPGLLECFLDRVVAKRNVRLSVFDLATKEVGNFLVFRGEAQEHVALHRRSPPVKESIG